MSRSVSCKVEKDRIFICVQAEDNVQFPCIQLTVESTWYLQIALEKAVKEALEHRRNQKLEWNKYE